MSDIKSVLNAIRESYADIYLEKPYLPPPFIPSGKLKAIVLGTDPSTKEQKTLNVVFGLDEDHRYFANILKNLNILGLSLENVYIQNACRNYFTVEAPENDFWEDITRTYWSAPLKQELDKLDPSKSIPVFATAEIILRALVNDPQKVKSAEDLYEDEILFSPDENLLERTLIPLMRHYAYSLEDWPEYAEAIRHVLTALR